MNTTKKLGLGAVALFLFGMQACSSEPAATPSRPPIPPPATTADAGTDGAGPLGSTCFDASAAKPSTPGEFLNQCNSTECFKFDNAARIEGFKAGPLPPLN